MVTSVIVSTLCSCIFPFIKIKTPQCPTVTKIPQFRFRSRVILATLPPYCPNSSVTLIFLISFLFLNSSHIESLYSSVRRRQTAGSGNFAFPLFPFKELCFILVFIFTSHKPEYYFQVLIPHI